MKRRRLGRSGLVVSEICLGTMTFGSMAEESESLQILDKALDAGINFIDSAEIDPVPPDAQLSDETIEACNRISGEIRCPMG